MRYAFHMDPKSKEVATVEELPEFDDDLQDFDYMDFSKQFQEVFETEDMIGPLGELDFDEGWK